MESDQHAVFALLGPEGTPRVPGAVGPLTCLVGEEEEGGGGNGGGGQGGKLPVEDAKAVMGGMNGVGGVDGQPGVRGGTRASTPVADGALEF